MGVKADPSNSPREALPDKAFVSLTEALTWLALGRPVIRDDLVVELERKSEADFAEIGTRIREALRQLSDEFDQGLLAMRGRPGRIRESYIASSMMELPLNTMADHQRYDIGNDGLLFGHGDDFQAGWMDYCLAVQFPEARPEGYFDVEVRRDNLRDCFQAKRSALSADQLKAWISNYAGENSKVARDEFFSHSAHRGTTYAQFDAQWKAVKGHRRRGRPKGSRISATVVNVRM